jgi:MFS family permease
MILSGITVALFPWGGSFTGWFVLRALEGCAGAMSLIPMETLVNRNSPRAQRARNFGFYALAVTLGWALGNLIGLQMHENWPRLAFALGGCASLLSGLAVYRWLPWPGDPLEGDVSALALPWRKTILSFGSAWSQGFIEGTMVAFLSIYLLFLGWSDVRVSWLTSGILVGIILFQVPVAWLADKLGRTKVLLVCYGVTALGLVLAPFSLQTSWLSFWLFLVGAFSGAFYPLGLSILGERIPESGLARANARYLAINCLGSLCGPVITGSVMERFGKLGMFWSPLAAVILVLGCWLGLVACDGKRKWYYRWHKTDPRRSQKVLAESWQMPGNRRAIVPSVNVRRSLSAVCHEFLAPLRSLCPGEQSRKSGRSSDLGVAKPRKQTASIVARRSPLKLCRASV